jgi:hypothetical protein
LLVAGADEAFNYRLFVSGSLEHFLTFGVIEDGKVNFLEDEGSFSVML